MVVNSRGQLNENENSEKGVRLRFPSWNSCAGFLDISCGRCGSHFLVYLDEVVSDKPSSSNFPMRLPNRIQDFFPSEAVKQLTELVSHPNLIEQLKSAAQKVPLPEVAKTERLQAALLQAKRWAESMSRELFPQNGELDVGVNATGVLFGNDTVGHRRTGECQKLASLLASQSAKVSDPNQLSKLLRNNISELVGSEDAVVFESVDNAILCLVLSGITEAGWLLPRTDCIRLESGALLPDLAATRSPSDVIEIGSPQECTDKDLLEAQQFASDSFLSIFDPARLEQANRLLAHRKTGGIICEVLYGMTPWDEMLHCDGWTNPLTRFKAGVDLVIFPTHGILGGPTGAVIAGASKQLDPLRKFSTRIGLSATFETQLLLHSHLSDEFTRTRWEHEGTGSLISTDLENLKNRSERMAIQLNGLACIESAVPARENIPMGAGVFGMLRSDSWVVRITAKQLRPATLVEKLSRPSETGKLDCIWIDERRDELNVILRSMEPHEDAVVVDRFEQIANELNA